MATPQTTCHIDFQPRGSIKTLKFSSHHLRHVTNLISKPKAKSHETNFGVFASDFEKMGEVLTVGKLLNHLKLCGLYLLALDQFLLYFIIQTVSNGLRFMMLQSFFAVLLLLQKLFLHFSIKLVTLMHAIYILGVRGILDSSSVLLTTIMEPIKEELIKSKY